MKLTNATEGILTASMAAVLEVMQRIPIARSGRAIAHSCQGVSVSQVNIVLRRLESIGIVTAAAAPPSKLYSLNHDHLMTHPLLALIDASSQVLNWLGAELANWQGVVSATIFGSVARGDDHEQSDLDLLVVLAQNQAPSMESVLDLQRQFLRRTGNSLGVVVKSMSELSAMFQEESAFIDNVLTEGKLLLGEELISLVERKTVETPSRTIAPPSASLPGSR